MKKYIYGIEKGLNVLSQAGNIRVLSLREIDDNEFYHLEQCTDLKDKNGKLIYEGDIIRFTKHIEGIKLDDCKAQVEFIKGYFNPVAKLGNEEIEVIGNIHENKDLLE